MPLHPTTPAARGGRRWRPASVRCTPAAGDVFTIRLEALGFWTVGVVSRVSVRWPNLVLAHHFPLIWAGRPRPAQLPPLSARDAVLISRVSDLALRDGAWPVIGSLAGWSVQGWPMPHFAVPPNRPGHPWREEIYYEHDPGHRKRSLVLREPSAARDLPDGGVVGARIAEERLTRILASRATAAPGVPGDRVA